MKYYHLDRKTDALMCENTGSVCGGITGVLLDAWSTEDGGAQLLMGDMPEAAKGKLAFPLEVSEPVVLKVPWDEARTVLARVLDAIKRSGNGRYTVLRLEGKRTFLRVFFIDDWTLPHWNWERSIQGSAMTKDDLLSMLTRITGSQD